MIESLDDDCESRSSGGGSSIARYSADPSTASSQPPQILLLYSILCNDNFISTRDHTKAAESLCSLQASLSNGCELDKKSQIKLICVITSLLRRIASMRAERDSSFGDTAAISALTAEVDAFVDTLTLTFVAVAIADVMARSGVVMDPTAAAFDLEGIMNRTLWSELSRASSKRRIDPGDEIDELERQRILTEEIIDRKFIVSEDSSAWAIVINQPGAVAGAASACCRWNGVGRIVVVGGVVVFGGVANATI